jgi:hypothetical protein
VSTWNNPKDLKGKRKKKNTTDAKRREKALKHRKMGSMGVDEEELKYFFGCMVRGGGYNLRQAR